MPVWKAVGCRSQMEEAAGVIKFRSTSGMNSCGVAVWSRMCSSMLCFLFENHRQKTHL